MPLRPCLFPALCPALSPGILIRRRRFSPAPRLVLLGGKLLISNGKLLLLK